MARAPGGWGWRVARDAALAVLVLVGLLALQRADADHVAPVVLTLAFVAGWAGGRFAHGLGLPAVLGWLAVGVVVGPTTAALLAALLPGFPLGDGLLGPRELPTATAASRVALGVAMVWLGAQLDVRRLGRGWRAVGPMLAGHVLAVAALGAVATWLLLESPLAVPDAARFVANRADVAGVTVSLLGTSALLVAAVLRDARAEGQVTRSILWLATLGEVAALAVLAGTVAWWDHGSGLLLASPGTPGWLLFTAVVGGVIGGLMAAGVRWSPVAGGPWVVVLAVVGALGAGAAELSPALLGLSAGLVLAHAAPGDRVVPLQVAADVALVVLFTVAGALLPFLDLLPYLPLAAIAAAGRLVILVGAALLLARLLRGPPELARHAWTALVASGIPVAGLVPWLDVDPAAVEVAATPTVWGMAVINGILGALAVHVAVGFARETADAEPLERPEAEVVGPDGRLDAARLPEGAIREQVGELSDDLQALVADARSRGLKAWSDGSRQYLEQLRREALRHHRRVVALAQDADPDAALRAAQVELADRWRAVVFDHAARMARSGWQPAELVELLDRLVQASPATLAVPAVRRPGGPLRRGFRVLTGWLVGASVHRVAPLREILAWHLSGRGPALLEPVAASLVNGELHLAARTRELFFRAVDAYRSDALDEAHLDAARDALTGDFAAAREEVELLVDEAAGRLATALDHLARDVAVDLIRVGALELPGRSRAFDRALPARQAGLRRLTGGWEVARASARTRFMSLSLELELVGLELEVREALVAHGSLVARLVRGRGTTQLARVEEAVDEALARIAAALRADEHAVVIADRLRAEAVTLSRVAADAAGQADELRGQLATEGALAPLIEALVRAGSALSHTFEVPVGVPVGGSWSLLGPVDTTEVPVRDVVLRHIETSVRRDLQGLTQRFAHELERAVLAIEEVDRAVGFNVELAAAELAADGDRPLGSTRRAAVHDTVFEGVERVRGTLRSVLEAGRTWYQEVDDRIRAAVLDDLETLRAGVAEGRFASLAAVRPSALPDEAARPGVRQRVEASVRRRLGDSGLHALRVRLGLSPVHEPFHRLTRGHFSPPPVKASIPLVYRRLFSEQALEAGELIGRREGGSERVRRALERHEGARLRTVAVVGPDGVGKTAIVRSAVRALRIRGVNRLALKGPVSVAEVEGWFERGTVGHVYMVSGFHWLHALRPGGFEPLRRFLDGVLADEGRNAWVVEADEVVWRFACVAAPLGRAFPEVVHIAPLGVDELEEALLARHEMSGFSLVFAEAGEGRGARHTRRAWFRDFHAASGGVARDALRLWLAAVREVDVGRRRVVMGPVPQVPTAALRHLSDVSALGLLTTLRQGWIDEATWARLFAVSGLDARAELAHLVHWGLLAPEGDRFVLPSHLRGVLAAQLGERGWL